MAKTWFITGAGRGFGRSITIEALKRGDNVSATVRTADALDDVSAAFGDALQVQVLDVTDRDAGFAAVAAAKERFGSLDIAVNNAGYGLNGMLEEVSEQQARTQMEVNFFGALHITQAVLPVMREQGSGLIVQISSIGGVVAFPGLSIYHASKWALEGMTEALANEVAGYGIKTLIVEPGGYGTDWGGSSAVTADQHPAYAPLHEARAEAAKNYDPSLMGDPDALARELIELVASESVPPRALLGGMITDIAIGAYRERIETWEAGRARAEAAQK
ncbi:SDR family NAD(P)-dependent oxidoreductase [Microbacterium arborescens]|uniref:SDR family NAD(P)-dependent oxidoreductase n=1 Tax=Microbacterium arborescens TaxID=33883 RepID=UPI003C766551